jgi:hypothetical protein
MFELVAQTTAAPQVAQANDGVTNFFVMLAVGAFVVVVLRLVRVWELGSSVLTTVGSVLAAVVVITVVALLLFAVLVAFQSLLTF